MPSERARAEPQSSLQNASFCRSSSTCAVTSSRRPRCPRGTATRTRGRGTPAARARATAAPRACGRTCPRVEISASTSNAVSRYGAAARASRRRRCRAGSRAARRCIQSPSGTGKPILSLRSRMRGGRSVRRRCCLSTCFSSPSLNFTSAGIVAANSTSWWSSERHARLEPVRHAHAVLDLQQRRQQRLEVEVRHQVEVRLLADVVGAEDRPERLERRVVAERSTSRSRRRGRARG